MVSVYTQMPIPPIVAVVVLFAAELITFAPKVPVEPVALLDTPNVLEVALF